MPSAWDLVAIGLAAWALTPEMRRRYRRWYESRPAVRARVSRFWREQMTADLRKIDEQCREREARRTIDRARREAWLQAAGATPELARAIVAPLPDGAAPAGPEGGEARPPQGRPL